MYLCDLVQLCVSIYTVCAYTLVASVVTHMHLLHRRMCSSNHHLHCLSCQMRCVCHRRRCLSYRMCTLIVWVQTQYVTYVVCDSVWFCMCIGQ